jgi:NADH-quinone oxidoreductase subunit A
VYECGVPPIGTARERFPIKFYLVCMLFILFDVDARSSNPWALIFRELGLYGLGEMAVFVFLLGGGFVYAWKVGALDW